jgi:release factor glutamine methyltransferase
MINQSIKSARKYISDKLSSVYPREEVSALTKIILLETTGLSATDLLTEPGKQITKSTWDKIKKICAELKDKRPIQYILGKTEFYGLEMRVNKHTLIPRQETEELVDLIIRDNKKTGLKVLDIGTGCGAIAISLCLRLNDAEVSATDISEDALIIARHNCKVHNCRISFKKENILEFIPQGEELFDLVVSNPPYVRESEKRNMHENVLSYEPHSALFVPDSDPLKFYRSIGSSAIKLLKPGGCLYLEINEALGKETGALISETGFKDIRIIKDLNNKDRILKAVR